jgi:glycosyltransferase involved in cell wall biosynthesis
VPNRKILLLNERDPRNPLAGGAEVHIFEIFKRLAAKGHEVELIAATFPGCKSEEMVDGIRVQRIANRYFYYGLVPFVLRRTIKNRGSDIVIDVLNKLPFLSPWFTSTPTFAIVHHLMGTTAFRQVSFPVAAVTWAMEKLIPFAYRRTAMFAISPSSRDDLIERGVNGDNVHVIPPGIDEGDYKGGEAIGSRQPLVAWVGRLEPYKCADHMIAAFAKVVTEIPDARLVVIGEGQARAGLEAKTAELRLSDRVTFTGFISEQEKITWLRNSAIVVNSSEKEGWGMTMIEGNACGAVAVASDVPGLRDSVRDGITGRLYPFADVDALARTVADLLGDPDGLESMSGAGRQWAERFSWDHVADDVESLLEASISSGGEPVALTASPFA